MYVNYAVTIAIGCYLTNYCSSQRAKCAHDLGGQTQYILRQWGKKVLTKELLGGRRGREEYRK